MASSLSAPTFPHSFTSTPYRLLKSTFHHRNRFSSPFPSKPFYYSHFHSLSRTSSSSDSSSVYRCHSNSSPDKGGGWDSSIQDAVRDAIHRVHEFLTFHQLRPKEGQAAPSMDGAVEDGGDDWDWDMWKKHFNDVDEQERIVRTLKVQLEYAIKQEDYKDAARLKVAIAAAASNDIVGRVVSHLNRAIKEEHYTQAALIRDCAGAGLVGWWSGISEGSNDPYGRIIRITAEHGRYVARGYSPRQLASSMAGAPLFEIFLTVDKKGEYKQQAVYLKRRRLSEDSQMMVPSSSIAANPSRLSTLDSTEDRSDLIAISTEDSEDNEDRDDDSDVAEGFQNILRDMIPSVKVKVLKVTAQEKVDQDMISKVIEQIMDEEDEDEDEDVDEDEDEDEESTTDIESVGTEDETIGEGGQQQDEIDVESVEGILYDEEQFGISVKFGGALVQKLSSSSPLKNLLRVPARVQKKGRLSFSFTIDEDAIRQQASAKKQVVDKNSLLKDRRNIDNVMFDLAKFVGTEKIPVKVLKDINQLIHFTLTHAQNSQPLTDTTTFNRLELSASSDPLNGLYIGAHGLYTSEVIQLRRKYGQWKQDGGSKESKTVEFYEYVEATKLTGDPYVPAGQVAFRAKVGKRNQLPHRGIIPEEFGVIARYRGQGRLAEPGFRNPRWVDGELVILDGKYIKGGPVVGFVYWAPEYHFLVFFNPLRLEE